MHAHKLEYVSHPGHQQPSILLIDDERDILDEYQEFLELSGYMSLTCSDPMEAIKMVLDRPDIRLVITDQKMAKLDGLGLIKQLRNLVLPQRDLKFVILTGELEPRLHEVCEDVRIVIKPADTDILLDAIRSALDA